MFDWNDALQRFVNVRDCQSSEAVVGGGAVRSARITATAALAAGALTLAGCSALQDSDGPSAARTWEAPVGGQPPAVDPKLPGQGESGGPPAAPTLPPSGQPPPGGQRDPYVVADKLDVPWSVAPLPDGTAYVGERETGRILHVQKQYAPAEPVYTIPGIDTTGDGGLLGLALSPSYAEDGQIFAYITTKTDNRVIRFSTDGSSKPIVTGIPNGTANNGGQLAFGSDGMLYIGTGDAGDTAGSSDSEGLSGKILRVTIYGDPAPGNPTAGSPIYASGFRDVTGLCFDEQQLIATDTGAHMDELDVVQKGKFYGWPGAEGPSRDPSAIDPVLTWKAGGAAPGACTTVESGLFVTLLDGKRVESFLLGAKAKLLNTKGQRFLTKTYGRLRGVAVAPDGALWITTSNRDGHGTPEKVDDRVIRIMPPQGSTEPPV